MSSNQVWVSGMKRPGSYDRRVKMPCGTMLEALSISELDKCARQYTFVGGLLCGLAGVVLSVLLIPILFITVMLPATAVGRFLHQSVGVGAAESELAVAVAVAGLLVLTVVFGVGRAVLNLWRRWSSNSAGDRWDLPFQCLARLAPHASGRDAVFSYDKVSRAPRWRWAVEVDLEAATRVRAMVERGPEDLVLTTFIALPGGEDLSRTWRWERDAGLWRLNGAAGAAMTDLAICVSARLMGDVSQALRHVRGAHHRLALWHEMAPLEVEVTEARPAEVCADGHRVLSQLWPRPEAEVVHPETSRARRTLWAGAMAYWVSTGLVLGAWGLMVASGLWGAWKWSAMVSGASMALLCVSGLALMMALVLRYRPVLPRRRPREVRSETPPVLALHTGAMILAQRGLRLERPFSVALSREERGRRGWILLGVRVYQDRRLCVEFSSPVRRSAETKRLQEQVLTGWILRPEDLCAEVWPVLRYFSAVHHRDQTLPEILLG